MLRGAFIAGVIAVGIAGAPVAQATPSTTTTSPTPTTGPPSTTRTVRPRALPARLQFARDNRVTGPALTVTAMASPAKSVTDVLMFEGATARMRARVCQR
jgi:hypothetical protein